MSRALLWVLRLLPALGLVFLVAGVGGLGQLPERWWDTKGFIVNIASGLTAACFGVPVAFFILQRLLVEREKEARRGEVETKVRAAVNRLNDLIVDRLAFGIRDFPGIDPLDFSVSAAMKALREIIRDSERGDGSEAARARILAGGDRASVDAQAVGQLQFPYETRAIEQAKAAVAYLSGELRDQALAEGWAALPSSALKMVASFLDWRSERPDPEVTPVPVAFDRVSSFSARDWPKMRQAISHRSSAAQTADGNTTWLTTGEKNTLLEAIHALDEARSDLGGVRTTLRALKKLKSEAQNLA